MDEIEIEVGFAYPLTYVKKRGRNDIRIRVRDRLLLSVPRLTEQDAPVVISGRLIDYAKASSDAVERRISGGLLIGPVFTSQGDLPTLAESLISLAAGELLEAVGWRRDLFHIEARQEGSIKLCDHPPLDVKTMIENGREVAADSVMEAFSGCAVIGNRFYMPDLAPEYCIRASRPYLKFIDSQSHHDNLERDIGDDPVHQFRFSVLNGAGARKASYLAAEFCGRSDSFREFQPTVLVEDILRTFPYPEAEYNAAAAAATLVDASSGFLGRMAPEGIDMLAHLIRLRDRALKGDETAFGGVVEAIETMKQETGFIGQQHTAARTAMQKTTIFLRDLMEVSAKPQPKPETDFIPDDGLSQLRSS